MMPLLLHTFRAVIIGKTITDTQPSNSTAFSAQSGRSPACGPAEISTRKNAIAATITSETKYEANVTNTRDVTFDA
jgi:hypothetical protein